MDETFKIEDEELDEIEYLEILSMDEIIKENPSFIAFSEKELYNELFNIFQNEGKAESLKKLIFRILENDRNSKGILKSYQNYVFVSSARKKDFTETDINQDTEYFNSLTKLNVARYTEAKNRYFFAIEYDDSDMPKIKPTSKINVELFTEENAPYPVYYPVFAEDDANMPIMAVYYRVPYATDNDYMYQKVLAHYFNTRNIAYVKSDNFTSVENLIKACKPTIDDCLQQFALTDDMIDYESIDNYLRKFDMSMDFLPEEDFAKLCDFVGHVIKDKERKNVYKALKTKSPELVNKKLVFYDRLNITMKLIGLSDKTVELLDNLKQMLNDKRMNDANVALLYNNVHDIIENINNGNVNLSQVVENIKAVQKRIVTGFSISTIGNLLKTSDSLDEIVEEYERMRDDFVYSRTHILNFENDKKNFVCFFHEIKDIVEGDNEDKYEGVPAILKNNDYEEFEEMGDDIVTEATDILKKNELDKYWLNLKYKDEHGFVELLKIILPMMRNMIASARLEIDYFLLCEELFNKFRGVPTKMYMFKKVFDEASIVLSDSVINDISKVIPRVAMTVDLNMGAEIKGHIVHINKEYAKIVYDAFVCAISWYILDMQERILNNSIAINENMLNNAYIDKWYMYGAPLQAKEKNGIIYYVCAVVDDMLLENNDYMMEKVQAGIGGYIEDKYKDKIGQLREKYAEVKNKKIEKGVLAQKVMIENIKNKKYDKIASDYIDALVYMPGVNYKKLHKFLLGCCLQKIGKDFYADVDLYENSRKDLIDIKKKFATRKETNKKRYDRFLPAKQIARFESDDDIQFMKLDEYNYNITHYAVQDWLDSMYDKNPLLSSQIIGEMKNNTRKCVEYIENYIEILKTTARNKNSELAKLFVIGGLNYKSFLLAILKILNEKEYDDDNIIQLQKISIESIRNIIVELDKLNKIVCEDNRVDIERINAFVCARAMCLPFNPDLNVNKYLVSVMDVPQIFIEENAKKIHNSIIGNLKSALFPSVEEITNFMNSKREENKQMKLNILNNKSVEENQLITKLKQAGIKHDLMRENREEREELEKDDIREIYGTEKNEEGEIEYNMEIEDGDYDDDTDRMEMGFIYSR